MKLRSTLLVSFLFIGALSAIIGVVGWAGTNSLSATINEIVDSRMPQVIAIKNINLQRFVLRAINLRAFEFESSVDKQDEFKSLLDQRIKADEEFARLVSVFNSMTRNAQEERNWIEMKAAIDTWLVYNETVKKHLQGLSIAPDMTAQAKIFNEYHKTLKEVGVAFEVFGKTALQLEQFLNKEMETAQDSAKETGQTVALVLLIILLTAITGSILAGLVMARLIATPIQKATELADLIAQGDTTTEVPQVFLKRKDEVGQLAAAFRKMMAHLKDKEDTVARMADGDFSVPINTASRVDKLGLSLQKMDEQLNDLLGQVTVAVEQVSSGSGQVASASQALSQGATEQASSLEEITSSLTEVSSQSKQNTEGATTVTQLAKSAVTQLQDGNSKMHDLVEAFSGLNSAAQGINKTVKVIDDIAFQINLLALNANVEAARAGKYGKGFAVVAEEVRNLANRSGQSVKETTDIVETILKYLKTSTELVQLTASKIQEVTASSAKVAEIAEEVALASKEQSIGLDQVSQGLDQIDQVTQANTASAEESASAAEELSGQSNQLQSMIARFALKNNAQGYTPAAKAPARLAPPAQKIAMPTAATSKRIKNSGPDIKRPISPSQVIALDDDEFEHF